MKKYFLSHPRKPINAFTLEDHLEDADRIAKELDLDLLEPFKLIPQDGSVNEHEARKESIRLLLRCDGLVLSGDWKSSSGCILEKLIAEAIDIPILIYKEKE